MLQIKYTLPSLLLLMAVSLFSQNIEKYYVNMPDKLNPITTGKIRLEIVEYHKAGLKDTIQNIFGSQVSLQLLDSINNYIVVKNTPNSLFEMKLLKLEDGALAIGVIRSVCAPVCQSVVEFYDTAWTRIPLQFNMPKAIQWIDDNKLSAAIGLDKTWVNSVLGDSFVSLHFDAVNPWIVASNNSPEYLSDDDRKVILPLLNTSSIVSQLEGGKWIQKR